MKKLRGLLNVFLVAFAILLLKDTAMASTQELTSLEYDAGAARIDNVTGRDGKQYINAIDIWDDSITFKLEGKYTELSASLIGPDYYDDDNGIYSVAFWGDGKKLDQWDGYEVSSKKAKSYTVDVTGVKSLKITVSNEDGYGEIYIVNAKLSSEKLTLSESTLKMSVKETTDLTWTETDLVTGETLTGTAKWKSSDTKVAKVSSKGKVIAKGIGSCEITCTVGKKSAVATVIVLPSKVSGISTAASGKDYVKLSWTEQTGVTGYKVYMYDTDTEEYTLVKNVKKGTSAKITDLESGTTYKFKVTAYVKVGKKTYNGTTSAVYKAKTSK